VNETDETVTFARFAGPEPSARDWRADEAAVDPSPASGVPGLVSLAFLTSALRRRYKLWLTLGLIGFIIGAAIYVLKPPPFKADSTIYIQYNINADNGDGGSDYIATQQSQIQSLPVAALAVKKLGLSMPASTFLSKYTVTVVTDQIVTLEMSAPSQAQAISWLNAVDSAALAYRATFLTDAQATYVATLNNSVAAAKAQISGVSAQIAQTPAGTKQLSQLRARRTALTTKLGALEQNVESTIVSGQVDTEVNIKGADVTSPAAAVHRSHFKAIGEDIGAALAAGLVIGMAIVIVQALVSTKLRRRYDVAQALAAPVRLSIGPVKARAAARGGVRRAAARNRGIRLMVRHLRDVRGNIPPPAALAVVPADEPGVAALALVSLALSYAQKGLEVVVADLSGGVAARLLKISEPGLHKVESDGTALTIFLAEPTAVAPIGPLAVRAAAADPDSPAAELVKAYGSADRLLTLAPLDPALGADHLATWASAAVVTVTAGQATAVKLRATGDMIRLAGVYLASAILIGADKTDESFGTSELPISGTASDAELLGIG